jgi:type I restriction enzyme S subunit
LAVKERKIARAAAPAMLPEGWRVVRFDEMAQLVNDRVDNPSEAGVERYVGLEHLDPESLKIRRWGSPDDVEAQKLRFQPSDIIFGKRRAYQRKLAVADFEGICSAHAMVLRAREETVVKDFLPFFMQSDTFFERALSISVGSLSPTINWKTLASQEFTIPPKNEQRRFAELLWSADDAIQHYEESIVGQNKLGNTLSRDLFDMNDATPAIPLSDTGTWLSGGTPSRARQEFWNGNIPWASPKDMKVDVLSRTEEGVSEEGVKSGSKLIPKDSILIVVRGMILAHTFPVAITGRPLAFNQDMKALIASEEFIPKYLFYWLKDKANDILSLASESSHGTKRLPTETLFRIPVPKPSIQEQSKVVQILQKYDEAKEKLKAHREQLVTLKKSLLNELLMNCSGPN